MTLWTNNINAAARQLYRACGFRIVACDAPSLMFGRMMASETWETALHAGD